jgi:hypothetical protein
VADGEEAFRTFLQSRNLEVSNIGVVDAINVWIDFYKARRFDDVEEGMDWLWFQYGTYEDLDDVPYFQLSLTRQFILEDETGDDGIWQMDLVLHFPPNVSPADGMETCEDPDNADEFRELLLANPPAAPLANTKPDRVELWLGQAG